MLERWINNCIRRPVATLVICAGIAVAGLYAALNLPLEILPSVDFPKLYIRTSWPGASPQSIEAYLTSIIESELTTIRGITNVRSESREGASKIEVELLPDADVDYLQFVIRERLSFVQDKLPVQAYPPRIIKYVPEEIQSTRFMSFHIAGPYSDAFLRRTALNRICPVINSVPGVAGSEVIGGRERMIQIIFDEDRLKAYRLSIAELTSTLRTANLSLSIGKLVENGQRRLVSLRQPLQSLYDLETLPLKRFGQRMIYLRDVAQVADTLSPAYSFQRINGRPTILLQIEKEPQANALSAANRVDQTVARLESRLPGGIQLIKEDDQSLAIRKNLRQLGFRALFSFLVILLALTLFLRRLSFAILIQSTVIISVLATLLLMFLFRYSLNLVTLAGLALGFGILVDNAIVVLENIDRRLRGARGDTVQVSAAIAASEVALPLLASTLTTIAALAPFLFLMDELRLYYTPFAATVSLALLASLLVSFFLIPTIAHRLIPVTTAPPAPISPKRPWNGGFDQAYQKLLKKILKRPWLAVLAAIWLFGIPLWMLPGAIEVEESDVPLVKIFANTYNQTVGSQVVQQNRFYLEHLFGGSLHLFYRYVSRGEIWQWDESTKIHAYISMPPGTAIEETDAIVKRLEQTVAGEPGISQVRSRVHPNYARVEVRFTPEGQYSVSPFLVKEKLIARAVQTGNARVTVVGYGLGFSSGGGGITFQNRLQLTGYNYRKLTRFAEGLQRKLERYPRVRDVRSDLTRRYFIFDAYETIFAFDRSAMANWQMNVAGILQQTQPFLSQYFYRQTLQLGWEEAPFAVVSRDYSKFQFYQLQNRRMRNANGQEVRLGTLGGLTLRRTQPIIERENQNYYKVISFDYLAPYRFTREFVDQFLEATAVPTGFSLKEKHFQWQDKDNIDITFVLLIALLLMYMTLAGLYESFLYPLLIFLMIPLSLIGVFLAYYWTDTTFDQAAYIGVIFLLGIVLNNAILLLDRINQLKREKSYRTINEVILTGCRERLRPILMTTLTTIAGLLPLLLLSDQHTSQDIWKTLSLSTIGGLLSSVLLGLAILPAMLLIIEKWKFRINRIFKIYVTTQVPPSKVPGSGFNDLKI